MNRRSLMKAVFGTAAAATAGVSPRDLVAATPTASGLVLGNLPVAIEQDPVQELLWRKAYSVRRLLERKQDAMRYPAAMPPHIASKKSWSDTYKHSEFSRELRALQDAYDAVQDNTVAAAIWDKLTGEQE